MHLVALTITVQEFRMKTEVPFFKNVHRLARMVWGIFSFRMICALYSSIHGVCQEGRDALEKCPQWLFDIGGGGLTQIQGSLLFSKFEFSIKPDLSFL